MRRPAKMLIALALTLLLTASACLPALAVWGTLYVNTAKVNVYELDDTSSKVIKKYSGGKKLTIDALSPDGEWAQITVGKKLGFVQTQYLSDTMPQSFCSHDWGKWTVEKEATCTEKGYRYRFCKICGIRDEQDTKKKDHDFDKWRVIKEATCVEKGKRVHTCKVCGLEVEEEYLKDHEFGSWTVTQQPTCTAKGARVHTCTVCGTQETQSIDMLPHDYEYRIIREATDHSSGVRAQVCRVCGIVSGEESFDPIGTLRRGSRGDDVRALQQALVDRGYLSAGGADGVYGGGTEKAIIAFQSAEGFTPDGIAWPQTLTRLNHSFGPWVTVKAVTRTEDGLLKRVCSDCGLEEQVTVESAPTFRLGAAGNGIRTLQQMLGDLGHSDGSSDGIYGESLDTAFAAFASAEGLEVEPGAIRACDVDALTSAWLKAVPEENWKGESGETAPVDLALRVVPDGKAVKAEGMCTYTWALMNKGPQDCVFTALLLHYGDDPDFKGDDIVMALDRAALKAGSGNILSGSITVADGWQEGALNFTALVQIEGTGELWLSNVAAFDGSLS